MQGERKEGGREEEGGVSLEKCWEELAPQVSGGAKMSYRNDEFNIKHLEGQRLCYFAKERHQGQHRSAMNT